MNRIKVLIVDDSFTVRQTMSEILSSDPEIEVIATASDPMTAADRIREEVPDVITLDIEMPHMDGLTFLHMIMSLKPIPVIICSSHAEEGSKTAMTALEYGAVDVILKPQVSVRKFFEEAKIMICDAVRAAAHAKLRPAAPLSRIETGRSSEMISVEPRMPATHETTDRIVVVGASTGGTDAIKTFLTAMPPDAPGILIVQHMPENFTKGFAERLDAACDITVKEAENNDRVLRGQALIAPGNHHMLLKRSGDNYHVEIKDGPLVSRHRPSVDVLFRSAARYAGRNAVGVIMTGMGNDGASGMREMKEAGATNIAQDEATCIVYGMPHEAVKLGGVDMILPIQEIAHKVLRLCSNKAAH